MRLDKGQLRAFRICNIANDFLSCLQGLNWVWHVDQYDKLQHYGFCIHGAIDGFSRRMWLRGYSTNRDPWIIARYYYETVKLIKGNCKENVICFTFEHVN